MRASNSKWKFSSRRSRFSDNAEPDLVNLRSCFAEDAKKCNKIYNACTQLLFFSLNFLFCDVLIAVVLRDILGTLRWLPIVLRSRERCAEEVVCARPKENVSVFRYFITSTWVQKAKLTVNFLAFPSVKFRKIWQIGRQYFTLVGVRFSGKSMRPDFLQR